MFTCGDFFTALDGLLSSGNLLTSWPVAILNPPLALTAVVVAVVYSILGCFM
jgi:hypothetical protein